MVRAVTKEHEGKFKVWEDQFHNLYYELREGGSPYAYVHVQLAIDAKYAYCHAYIERFGRKELREIRKDWFVITEIMRAYGMEKAVGTKIDRIALWIKFLKLLGFKEEGIGPTILNSEPCMMAVMEL